MNVKDETNLALDHFFNCIEMISQPASSDEKTMIDCLDQITECYKKKGKLKDSLTYLKQKKLQESKRMKKLLTADFPQPKEKI